MEGTQGDAAAAALKQWLRDLGGSVDDVVWLAVDPEAGRGLAARRAVAEGEPLLRIPREAMLTLDAAAADAELGPLLEKHGHKAPLSDPARVLTLLLANEARKGGASKWAAYIDSLPRTEDFDDFIDRWQPEELRAVRHQWLPTLARGKAADISGSYSALQVLQADSAPPQLLPTPERWRWAYWAVESRAFLDRSTTETAYPVLIPLADMLNHNPAACDAVDFDAGGFTLTAARDLGQGQDIFISYGRRTNRELLVTYGFAIRGNPWDFVTVQLPWACRDASASSPAAANAAVATARDSLLSHYDPQEVNKLFAGAVPSRQLLWLFRVWRAADLEELQRLRANPDEPVSVRNEREAVRGYLASLLALDGPSKVADANVSASAARRRERASSRDSWSSTSSTSSRSEEEEEEEEQERRASGSVGATQRSPRAAAAAAFNDTRDDIIGRHRQFAEQQLARLEAL